MKLNSLSNEDQTIINTDSENIIKKTELIGGLL